MQKHFYRHLSYSIYHLLQINFLTDHKQMYIDIKANLISIDALCKSNQRGNIFMWSQKIKKLFVCTVSFNFIDTFFACFKSLESMKWGIELSRILAFTPLKKDGLCLKDVLKRNGSLWTIRFGNGCECCV